VRATRNAELRIHAPIALLLAAALAGCAGPEARRSAEDGAAPVAETPTASPADTPIETQIVAAPIAKVRVPSPFPRWSKPSSKRCRRRRRTSGNAS